jgi:uncharacterized protein YcfJ
VLQQSRVSQQQMELYLSKTLFVKLTLAASALTITAAPIAAEAQTHHAQRVLVCPTSSAVRRNANNGTIIGAAGGALVGQAIGHNTGGTLIGAGVGAVAGHEIARHRAKRNCHYEYR